MTPKITDLLGLFGTRKPVIGVVHLPPLPGSPLCRQSLEELVERALKDAETLEEGGIDGVLVENYGDKPFRKKVGPETIATMSIIVEKVVKSLSIPVGVNILRSDCLAALAVASVTGARFIRCNVFTDTLVTDQGIIEPCAWELMSYRRMLGSRVMIFADILCKHAKPLVELSPEESARNAAYRGMADAIILTGRETGLGPDPRYVERVRKAVPDVPLLIGSGFTPENAEILLKFSDGAIVGTYLKRGGVTEECVDLDRVRKLMSVVKELRRLETE
ncbi:MAG: hypothetical protein DRO05_07015 [Thermoproteota archaeon]|nr:MAG: hypothetical protein DRO05_07015 [Candidatus Korarchaeota archaeon]